MQADQSPTTSTHPAFLPARRRPFWRRSVLGLSGLLGVLGAPVGAQTYQGPQAVVYIGERWCSGGYCSGSVYAAFEESLTRALAASGYVRAVRQQGGAALDLKAGVTDVSRAAGVCLPFLGCLNGVTVRASLELVDRRSGEVRWQDTCEGTSAGYSNWSWWSGSVYLDSDDGKAAADCAGKLTQKLTGSGALKTYLTLAPGAAVNPGPSPAPAPQPAASAPATPALPSAAEAVLRQLEGTLRALAYADANALFTSDPFNPVKLRAVNAAATAATLQKAAALKFTLTPGETAGPYQLLGVTYALPGGPEKFVQLAVTADATLNPRGGLRIVYLSAFNPLRATPALDGLSRNVETLLNDLQAALGLPGL